MSAFLEILRPGLQTIVVDRGRVGHRAVGVASCGALDAQAFTRANALLGNGAESAALEIAYGSFACRFEQGTTFALTGADCSARLDRDPISTWSTQRAGVGSTLELAAPRSGVRTYLAVGGGFDVPLVLGSRTTDLRAGFGGWRGRALRAGDTLAMYADEPVSETARALCPLDYPAEIVVRAMARNAPPAFWTRPWRVSHESNRMGCRLLGEPVTRGSDVDSYAVFPGVVQLPPGGEPIVLLADAQTTGGYTPIAVVIEEDLGAFAQVTAGTLVRFTEVHPDAD